MREGWFAIELLVERGRCTGVLALRPDGEVEFVRAVDVVLATGGAGQCFAVTTNPTLSTGDGVALALKAGVACADLEFVQFHPTALHHPSMPRPLLSEALRGEGAVLRDDDGVAFMADVHPLADLAPRDVVRARDPRAHGSDRRRAPVARRDDDRRLRAPLPDDLGRVPDASASTRRSDWLPVAPAAHYLSGGVVTDLDGATTLPHLWACGETACSGVHGANRLASNSLLDGLVFGRRVVTAIVAGKDERRADRRDGRRARSLPTLDGEPSSRSGRAAARSASTEPDALRGAVQRAMSSRLRCRARRRRACSMAAETLADLAALADDLPARDDRDLRGDQPAARLARDRRAPRSRARSRGARTPARDYPGHRPTRWLGRFVVRGEPAPRVRRAARPSRRSGRQHDRLRSARVRSCAELVAAALAEDLGVLGDITSIACVGEDQTAVAVFVAREEGVLAGTALVDETSTGRSTTTSRCEWRVRDGESVEAGTEIGRGRRARCASILTGERVALNFLCHCSGVASLTRRYVRADARQGAHPRHAQDAARPARRAEGGGARGRRLQPPRLALRRGADQGQPPRRARAHAGGRAGAGPLAGAASIEVECDTLDQVVEARDAGVDLVLLDNMTPDAGARRRSRSSKARRKVEVSGGVTLDTVGAYAETGADFISVGAITHSVRVLDIGLDIR